MRSISMITLLALCSLAAIAGSHKVAPGTKFNLQCPSKELLPRIDFMYHRCDNGDERSCKIFVSLFVQAIPTYDCHRDFDQDYVVPALWLADAAEQDYVRLLSKLKFPEAQKLFASEDFRSVLDGELAEEYLARSHAVEKALSSHNK